jgi:hypothetical protein
MKEPKSVASLELGQGKAREAQSCFVVMPFGKKPRDPTQDPHDFEEIGAANCTTLLAEALAPAGDTPRAALCARPPMD